MSEGCSWLCKPLAGCLSCVFCDILCCECNCLIFPAPRSPLLPEGAAIHDGPVKTSFSKFTANGKTIPFVQISTQKSRTSEKCFIYFHGNAEDISVVSFFLEPLVEQLDITFYSIEYPSYSTYTTWCQALISNNIKQDSLAFYEYLIRTGRTGTDIYVMGRSIGSGGASYLAGHRNIPLLVLMSPFDSIRNVAMNLVGCMGCIVKQHFNNEEQIVKFNGRLLVIHGQADEVINVQHGKKLVSTYEMGNSYKNRAKTVFPRMMTHNRYDLDRDIVQPIKDFVTNSRD